MKYLKTFITFLVLGGSSLAIANTPGTLCTKGMAIDTTTQELCVSAALFLKVKGKLNGQEFTSALTKCELRATEAYAKEFKKAGGQCPSTSSAEFLAEHVKHRTLLGFVFYTD